MAVLAEKLVPPLSTVLSNQTVISLMLSAFCRFGSLGPTPIRLRAGWLPYLPYQDFSRHAGSVTPPITVQASSTMTTSTSGVSTPSKVPVDPRRLFIQIPGARTAYVSQPPTGVVPRNEDPEYALIEMTFVRDLTTT